MKNCQQNGHSFTESEIPGTRREITEYGSQYAEYQVDVVTAYWEVRCVCARCGHTETQSRSEHKKTFIDGKEF